MATLYLNRRLGILVLLRPHQLGFDYCDLVLLFVSNLRIQRFSERRRTEKISKYIDGLSSEASPGSAGSEPTNQHHQIRAVKMSHHLDSAITPQPLNLRSNLGVTLVAVGYL